MAWFLGRRSWEGMRGKLETAAAALLTAVVFLYLTAIGLGVVGVAG